MATVMFENVRDDEIMSIFESEMNYNIQDTDAYRTLLMSSQGNRPGSTSMRLGTASGFQRQTARPGTGFRPITTFRPETGFRMGTGRPVTGYADAVNRPMTAVRGAGYTSHGKKMFDPLNQAAQMGTNAAENAKEETAEDKIRNLENKIMNYIEESIVASGCNKQREALEKAKEASSKERNLIRLQEQAGLSDSHNMDLTFMVLYNLANQYANNELYSESINTYQLITRNKTFSSSHRLKVNMGNIFFRQGHYHMAVKMYRMALDQVPSSQNNFRIKIMHNIAMVFVRMGQYSDAVVSLEYIMSEGRGTGLHLHKTGLHLILCHYALEDRDKMKLAFTQLLDVPLDIDDEDKYKISSDDPEEILIADAIREDELHKYEKSLRSEAEYCILTAAKLISPVIQDTFAAGYEWCVQAIKNSAFLLLAGDLEINKSVMCLKQRHVAEAIDTLKVFEKESRVAGSAATNLSYIYYLQGDLETAERYGEVAKSADGYNSGGLVNLGACALRRGDGRKAKRLFETALDVDPSNVEALYNLGLAHKQLGEHQEALACFQRFAGPLSLLPEVLYQMGWVLQALGDTEAAADYYQQLLGVVPTDPGLLQRLGRLYDSDGDKQQAYHYHMDAFRHSPSNLELLNWLGSYFIELQVVERAQAFFEKASLVQPSEPKWQLMVAGCQRRAGNMHRALALYQEVHARFPESAECLRLLVRLCHELGMREEAAEHTAELKRLERARDIRDRIGSSRPGTASRRSGSSLSSRSGASRPPSKLAAPRDSVESLSQEEDAPPPPLHSSSSHAGVIGLGIDASYADPLGPSAARPRTSAGKNIDEDFGDEQIGDDLLPE